MQRQLSYIMNNLDYSIQNQVTHSLIGNKIIEELVVISEY